MPAITPESWDETSTALRAAIDFATSHGGYVMFAEAASYGGPRVQITATPQGATVAEIVRSIGGSWTADNSNPVHITQTVGGVTLLMVADDEVHRAYSGGTRSSVIDWTTA